MALLDEPGPLPRLLFVSGTPSSVRQGSGTYVGISLLCRALQARGCVVDTIAPANGPATLARRVEFNLGRRHMDLSHYDAWVGFDLDGLFVRQGRGEHAPLHVAAIKGVLAEEKRFERGWTRLSLGVQAWLEARHARQASLVLAPSAYAAAALRYRYRVPESRLRVVAEPIDLAAWRRRLEEAPRRRRGEPTILCVAHLYPRKDVATLLRAFARLQPPAQLRIVGDGPEMGRLQRLARKLGLGERCRLLGHLPFADLAAEYANADLFCLPSRQEAFGIVLLEAMAAGLPILAARAAAIPEVVPEGDCGWLFPAGDEAGLAAALERLLAEPAARGRMGEAGRRHVRRFDAPAVAEAFLRVLVAAGPRG